MKSPRKLQKAANSPDESTAAFSRRDFITAAAATGIAMGVGQPAMASPEVVAPSPENSLPNTKPEMYTGTPSGAVLAQLKAAGVRTLFHTNMSGFVPFFEAIYAAGDVQVINMTHEGQGVAAAAGYTMASRKPGILFRRPRRAQAMP